LFGNFFDVHHYIFQKVVYYLFIYSFFRLENTASSKMAMATKIQAGIFFISLQNHM